MQSFNKGYDLQAITNHFYKLPTNLEKRVYLSEQIEKVVKLMIKCKEEYPGLYNGNGIPDILSRVKGELPVPEQFQSDIDTLKVVLNTIPENENPAKNEAQKNTLPFPKETLRKVVNNNAIDKFTEIEDRLLNDRYFNEEGKWIRTLDECAALIIKLLESGYFLPKKKSEINIWITKTVKRFFENRYNITFSKQLQPKYRKDKKLLPYLSWIENVK